MRVVDLIYLKTIHTYKHSNTTLFLGKYEAYSKRHLHPLSAMLYSNKPAIFLQVHWLNRLKRYEGLWL